MSTLPEVVILATGGTIAGKGQSSTEMTSYIPGEIGIQSLIDAVPEIKNFADISGEQIANIASYAMNNAIWIKLANRVNELLAGDVDGIVVTHGTDTLEETAYFLNLVVKSERPVVFTGAMRPATALSADGPVNLLHAVRLAGSREARGKGVLVMLNDQINSAREVTKSNTTHVETFTSPDLGFLGYFQNGRPCFYRQSTRRHTSQSQFDIDTISDFPRVDIIYGHANNDRILVDAAVAAGASGIVHAGMGHGNINPDLCAGLLEAQQKGVVVVKSSRTGSGLVSPVTADIQDNFVAGDTLNPQKARILLMLALTKTNDPAAIQNIFDEY